MSQDLTVARSATPRHSAVRLSQPEGLALTPLGSLIIAETGAKRLIELTIETGAVQVVAEVLPIGLPLPSNLPSYAFPTGVVVDAGGSIFVSADVNNALYQIDLYKPAQ